MGQDESGFRLYSAEFVERNFARLREAAIQDLTRYTCGWSIYSINFLNAVAELQGVDARLGGEVVTALRRDAKRVRNPRLAELMREARDARSMKIEEIMALISAEAFGEGAEDARAVEPETD